MYNILDELATMMLKKNNLLNSTNALKVLGFMVKSPGREYTAGEVLANVAVSRPGVYLALKQLVTDGLVIKKERGKFTLYQVPAGDPFIKQFKILLNISVLRPAISGLSRFSKKIVLFGSAGRGEDSEESDIDLFILAKHIGSAHKAVEKLKLDRKIQAVIKTPSDLADFRERNAVFYDEIMDGITLWEAGE